jgi:hypothetical protein
VGPLSPRYGRAWLGLEAPIGSSFGTAGALSHGTPPASADRITTVV